MLGIYSDMINNWNSLGKYGPIVATHAALNDWPTDSNEHFLLQGGSNISHCPSLTTDPVTMVTTLNSSTLLCVLWSKLID